MKKGERSSYSTLDFAQWKSSGNLVISPKFQRRAVWGRPAQSFLVDTLLLNLPVPPIYIRVTQDRKKGMVREIIDGQQRLSAVLSYVNGDFALAKNIESTTAIGRRFSELTQEQQDAINQYSFICEVFYGVEDADILKIFARLNMHSVKLNPQELRNGKFFGEFKRTCYDLSFEHLEFWRSRKIFGEQSIARMLEVELTGELVIAMMAGLQDKKKSIDTFYKQYDESFLERDEMTRRFRLVIDTINEAVGEFLRDTEFRRVPLFYTLFTCIAHRMFGVPGVDLPFQPTARLARIELDAIHSAIRELSNVLENATDNDGEVAPGMGAFVLASQRQTDNVRPRRIRLETLYKLAFL